MSDAAEAPGLRTLVDWLEGRLDDERAVEVEAVVAAGDAELSRTVTWLQTFLADTSRHRLQSAPPLVRQRLNQHFRRWSAGSEPAASDPPPIIGQLVFDSRRDRPRTAVRGSPGPGTTHFAYTSPVADVVVDVSPQTDGLVRLEGQVLMADDGAAPVFAAELTTPAFTLRSVDGDEHGRFGFEPCPPAPGRLTLSNGEFSVVVAVGLGEAP